MTRPEDIEWCCGAVCDAAGKLSYIEGLEAENKELMEQVIKLQEALKEQLMCSGESKLFKWSNGDD